MARNLDGCLFAVNLAVGEEIRPVKFADAAEKLRSGNEESNREEREREGIGAGIGAIRISPRFILQFVDGSDNATVGIFSFFCFFKFFYINVYLK